MADPSSYRPAPGSIPTEPGVYRFLDELGRVIYVGKAKSLRSRLSSYFGDEWGLHPRTRTMVTTAARVEWTVVATEVEALQLEYAWIKEFDPRFNVRYRDDKSYPWLAVSVDEEFPRAMVIRGAKRRGLRYFGPYAHAWAIRETLDSLLRVFPVRSCSAGVFRRAAQTGRPCLLGYIGKCAAPCVGRIDEEAHRALVTGLCEVLAGSPVPTQRRLEREMRAAAATQEYERAARLRDDLRALERAMERQAVVLPDDADADVIAVAEDPLECAVQVFYVRGGRVRGQRGFVVERDDGAEAGDVVADFLGRAFAPDSADLAEAAVGGSAGGRPGPRLGRAGPDAPRRRRAANDGPDVPREIIASALPADDEVRALADWLTGLRGSRVTLRVPQRGEKRALLDTVQRNAEQSLATHKLRRAGDLTARSRALEELQEALDLPAAPLRIECIDVSNLAGSDVVASLVVFEDGVPRKSEYKRYALRTVGRPEPGSAGARAAAGSGGDGAGDVEGTGDDVAAVHEVVTRRFRRYLDERAEIGELEIGMVPEQEESAAPPTMIDPTTGRPRSFAYAPNLLVVDGGAPQVAAAARALADLGVDDVALCGLAKRLEEVWLPGEPDPVVLPRTSEALYLLQRVRDEAHRFAITYHRQKRSKRVRGSALDDIPGVGATRRAALLGAFGSVARLREAGVEEIAAVPGVGPAIAAAVVAALTGQAPAPAPGAAVGPAGQAGPTRRSRGPAIPAGVDPVTGEILSTPGEPGGPDPALRPDSPSPPAPHSGGRATSGVATSGVGEQSQASDAGHSEPPPGVVAAPDEAPPHVGGAA